MLRSMTGIGFSAGEFESSSINIEIKSVNHRYFDIFIKMPSMLSVWEKDFRDIVKSKVKRGKISLSIYFDKFGSLFSNVNIDIDFARHYYNAIKTLSKELRIPLEISIKDFLTTKGVFELKEKEPDEELKNFLISLIDNALESLINMKYEEGAFLEKDIKTRLAILGKHIEFIEKSKDEVVQRYKERLKENLEKIFKTSEELINEKRIEFEIIQFADKVDITEEIVRFKSHIQKFYKTMELAPPVGKTLDFILQELNREINTISSKNNLSTLTDTIIETKTQIEKIREQVQNIE